MKKKRTMATILTVAAAGALMAAPVAGLAPQAQAQSRVEVGTLTCTVEGGAGFIIGSTKNLSCELQRTGTNERYAGTINKFGLDVGATQKTVIVWTVLAPKADVPSGALKGSYGGVSAEATVGAGIGANALIGGFEKSIVLQPLSIQAQQGLNIAVGISSLTLRPVA